MNKIIDVKISDLKKLTDPASKRQVRNLMIYVNRLYKESNNPNFKFSKPDDEMTIRQIVADLKGAKHK